MRSMLIRAMACAAAVGGLAVAETSVVVREGTVKAVAPAGVAQAAAGQKIILAGKAGPVATVDNSLVARVMDVDKLAQAEIAAGQINIKGTLVQAIRLDSEQRAEVALLTEMKNEGANPSADCRIGNMLLSQDLQFYAMDGTLLTFDVKKRNEKEGTVFVHFPQPVPPGGSFKFTSVSTFDPEEPILSRRGNVWRAWTSNASRNYLNYVTFILPASAIYLDSNRQPMMISSEDGRVALTFRNYTGNEANGATWALFLWPEKDGTSIDSLLSVFEGDNETIFDKLKRETSEPWEGLR